MRRCWAWTLAVLLLAAAHPASAAGEEGPSGVDGESEQYIQRGIQLRMQGRNQDALDAFQHAYALSPTPRAIAQMALAHNALAEWIAAERGIEEALRAGGDPWIDQYREVLERALAAVRSHLAMLYVDANVTQGELLLNGSRGEALPAQGQPIRVVAGTLRFVVRAPGFVAVQRTLEVAPEAQVHVVVTLDPIASPEAPRQALAASFAAPVVPSAGESVMGDPRPEGAHESTRSTAPIDPSRRTWGYVALGTAGVLAGAGIVAWRVNVDNAETYNDDGRCLQGSLTRQAQCGRYASRANLALGLEIGAFGGAVTAAGLGAWLLWVRPARSLRQSAACAPWSTLGVLCTSHF